MTLASTVFGYLGRGGEKVSSQNKLVSLGLIRRVFGFFVLPHLFNVLVLEESVCKCHLSNKSFAEPCPAHPEVQHSLSHQQALRIP